MTSWCHRDQFCLQLRIKADEKGRAITSGHCLSLLASAVRGSKLGSGFRRSERSPRLTFDLNRGGHTLDDSVVRVSIRVDHHYNRGRCGFDWTSEDVRLRVRDDGGLRETDQLSVRFQLVLDSSGTGQFDIRSRFLFDGNGTDQLTIRSRFCLDGGTRDPGSKRGGFCRGSFGSEVDNGSSRRSCHQGRGTNSVLLFTPPSVPGIE
jgi:hypothetical protein